MRAEALARPSAALKEREAVHQQSALFLVGINFGDVVAAHVLWQEGASALPQERVGQGITSILQRLGATSDRKESRASSLSCLMLARR